MSARVHELDEALAAIADGMVVAIGGSPSSRKPVAAVSALAGRGLHDLELVTFTGSLDVELLVAAGAVRSVRSSHVSLGEAGRAAQFAEAVLAGTVQDLEESAWMLLGGLRAAAAGMPFLPTRAGLGSDLAAARRLRQVADPYTGEWYLAVPALAPHLAIIHAWRSDATGNIQMPWPPDHLADVDVLMARAARHTIVTVEEIVAEDVIRDAAERTVLFGFEVDAVVEAPRGAWPTASPYAYHADPAAMLDSVAKDATDGIEPLKENA
jgi:glutaconate CoA-transferase subunit A